MELGGFGMVAATGPRTSPWVDKRTLKQVTLGIAAFALVIMSINAALIVGRVITG